MWVRYRTTKKCMQECWWAYKVTGVLPGWGNRSQLDWWEEVARINQNAQETKHKKKGKRGTAVTAPLASLGPSGSLPLHAAGLRPGYDVKLHPLGA